MIVHRGTGVINSLINNLPFEAHLPGYQYCGPGTKLQKRLQRGDPGINPLDVACKRHDIAYSQSKNNMSQRHRADKELQEAAWTRVKAGDSKLGEKAAALAVAAAMKIKRKTGMGIKKTALGSGVVAKARKSLKGFKRKINRPGGIKEGSSVALSAAKLAIKDAGGRKKIRTPRIIPIPKRGGFLPLIPLFAGLSALGTLAGGAAGIAKAVSSVGEARKKLSESERHNKTMEAIALGKKGQGLYLKPYRKGMGLYLKPQASKNC